MWGLVSGVALWAAGSSADSTVQRVRIVRADAILRDPAISGAQRLVGDVVLAHRDAELHCDSAWRYEDGRFRAMGQVVAERPGAWRIRADALSWNPVSEQLDAQGSPVRLEQDDLAVTGPVLRYGWEDDVAWFPDRTVLESADRTAEADRGRYEASTGWLALGGRVEVVGEAERVKSDSLKVHAREGDVVFCGRSVVKGTDGEWAVVCERGEWGEEVGWVAGVDERAWVRSGADGIWGDSLVWGEVRREAWGHVEAMDTGATRVVRGAHWVQFRVDSVWVSEVQGGVERAVLVEVDGGDTVHVEADFLRQDAEGMRAFPEVRFRQGDARGRCDTLIWFEKDSVMRFERLPQLWFEGQILSADTIELFLQQAQPHLLHGLGHARLTRALNDSCADQITGRTLNGTFRDGALHRVLIEGNAEAIYYVEEGKDLQFNRTACSRMRIHLVDGRVHEIALLDAPSGRFLDFGASTEEERWLSAPQLQPAPVLPLPTPWPPRPASEMWRPQIPLPQP